ncbi:uncharacterized protein E5676_scaffold266G002950 [Cucumis melo var. makuwa]|uniref:Agglutinin domain-containing protein n=2 Tax=Cucumis melo TaxID=3656 RepID=A0A5D3DMB4_CUCMM|nr:uncharacterized protein E6C27_scaffold122G00250 [Cucumis melo var. makuwa]TYK24734.1 uncharacterized protein E5676_scaffold266G002950 [Cucumis melo var. makuwa]
MSSFPRRFSLKSISNNLYLRYVHGRNELNGFLQFSAKEAASPYTMFEIEESSFGHGYVHIRCCYNNKYWALQSPSSSYIVATANEKDETLSEHSCTLFKPNYKDNDNKHDTFRFRHVFLNSCVFFQPARESAYHDCLMLSGHALPNELSTVINWDTYLFLPRHVAFKSLKNNKYLQPKSFLIEKTYQLALNGSNTADPKMLHEVIKTPDGHFGLKNLAHRKFFTRVTDGAWIVLDNDSSTAKDDPGRLFWPIKLDHNVVALRSAKDYRICAYMSSALTGHQDGFEADLENIEDSAKLEVMDFVLSRHIYNVGFHLSDARRYNEKPLLMTSTIVENNNSQDKKFTIKLSYQDTTTSTWRVNVNPMLGIKMKFETAVPKVSEEEIEFCSQLSEDYYTWGETHQMKYHAEVVHEVTVPAGTKVKASVVATQASCDIPFSYIQRDKLNDGGYSTQRYHDGLYNVVNSYNFHFVVEKV